jgi:hypothetical protein
MNNIAKRNAELRVAALLRHLASGARLLTEEAAEEEMATILREFAQQHQEFLRTQECEPALPAPTPVTRS